MNDSIIIVFLIFLSFVMGFVPVLLLGRGLFWKYIQAFISGRTIAVVHLKRGGYTFRLTNVYEGASILKYKLRKKKDVHSVSTPEGSVIRGGLVSWIHLPEGSSSPFIFKNYVPITEEVDEEVLNDKKEVVGVQKVQKVKYYAFTGYDDSSIIKQLFDWALIRPKTFLGSIPWPMLIIGLVVVVAVIIVISAMGGAGAENVI